MYLSNMAPPKVWPPMSQTCNATFTPPERKTIKLGCVTSSLKKWLSTLGVNHDWKWILQTVIISVNNLTWQHYSFQEEIQANSLFILLAKLLLWISCCEGCLKEKTMVINKTTPNNALNKLLQKFQLFCQVGNVWGHRPAEPVYLMRVRNNLCVRSASGRESARPEQFPM